MTPRTFILIAILIVIVWFVIGAIFGEENGGCGYFLCAAFCLLSLIIYWNLTPTLNEMVIYRDQKVLSSKPECMVGNEDGHDLDCLVEYKHWLDDSAFARQSLDHMDSLRANLLEEIKEKHQPDETDSSANRN